MASKAKAALSNGNGADVVQVEPAGKVVVSQATLDLLVQGRSDLAARRAQVAQELANLDARLQRQEGAIELMQALLAQEPSP